ncbi:separin [Chrysoperla carnea]|uniref:separin n=1 Tax=Chrysoperla carnea TaxID=189513 RepID=UPI001D063008|nr:separin [Chrysoperla carnea]
MDLNFKDISFKNIDELLTIALKKQSHNPNGTCYSMLHKQKAIQSFASERKLDGIYHLSESHFPTLRSRTSYRYARNSEKGIEMKSQTPFALSKNFIEFQCDKNFETDKQNLLSKVKELPSEWTLVQMTSIDFKIDCVPFETLKNSTPEFYLTLFKCGDGNFQPFSVKIDAPINNEKQIDLAKELRETILKLDENPKVNEHNIEQYCKCRNECNISLKQSVYQMEFCWLKKWRFLLLGKLVNLSQANKIILPQIDLILKEFKYTLNDENKNLIESITLGSPYLSRREIAILILGIIPDNKDLSTKLSRTIGDISQNNGSFLRGPRHPVILILDQQLDYFPWEACEILKHHPVSRLPSIHYVYALYAEHKENIINGLVTNISPSKGAYVINPGKDLPEMELRMSKFFKYWTPDWQGNIGDIESDTYKQLLINSDIFCYNGHGSGVQFLSGDVIQKLRVKGVVMLFGCESVAFSDTDVGISELRGTYDNYLMACSACVVGNLYKVTSKEMDFISTNLLSMVIPSKVDTHWKYIDKSKWNAEGKIVAETVSHLKETQVHEPELLRAVCLARQTSNLRCCVNELALVCRGLPVLIK